MDREITGIGPHLVDRVVDVGLVEVRGEVVLRPHDPRPLPPQPGRDAVVLLEAGPVAEAPFGPVDVGDVGGLACRRPRSFDDASGESIRDRVVHGAHVAGVGRCQAHPRLGRHAPLERDGGRRFDLDLGDGIQRAPRSLPLLHAVDGSGADAHRSVGADSERPVDCRWDEQADRSRSLVERQVFLDVERPSVQSVGRVASRPQALGTVGCAVDGQRRDE